MTTNSPSITKTAAALVAASLLIAGAEAEEVSVALSNGTELKLKEPEGMMGLTWDSTRSSLPTVFLLVDKSATSERDALMQLARTARAIGHLYVDRYDLAAGGAEDGADLAEVEATLAKLRSGRGSEEDRKAIVEGEAVILWSAMLEDTLSSLKIGAPTSDVPNSSPVFLEAYANAVERGEGGGIYQKVISAVARDNPSAFRAYLDGTTPERRKLLEAASPTRVTQQD